MEPWFNIANAILNTNVLNYIYIKIINIVVHVVIIYKMSKYFTWKMCIKYVWLRCDNWYANVTLVMNLIWYQTWSNMGATRLYIFLAWQAGQGQFWYSILPFLISLYINGCFQVTTFIYSKWGGHQYYHLHLKRHDYPFSLS